MVCSMAPLELRLAGRQGVDLRRRRDTTGMFTGAVTWLALFSRGDGLDTTDGPPGEWTVQEPCLENERVENGCARPARRQDQRRGR